MTIINKDIICLHNRSEKKLLKELVLIETFHEYKTR